MIRCIRFVILGVLTFGSAAAAELAVSPQAVQKHSKADNLLLSEIPNLVGEWTLRCTNKEAGRDPTTSVCWIDAASALTPYTKGFSDDLTKKVEQLQANWLERAAQLQSQAQPNSPGEVIRPADTATMLGPVQPRKLLQNGTLLRAAKKQVGNSSTQFRSVVRRLASKKLVRTVGLIQSRKQQRHALKRVKTSKPNIVPAAVERPVADNNYSPKRITSERRAIPDKLLTIENKVECSTLVCALSKEHQQ